MDEKPYAFSVRDDEKLEVVGYTAAKQAMKHFAKVR